MAAILPRPQFLKKVCVGVIIELAFSEQTTPLKNG